MFRVIFLLCAMGQDPRECLPQTASTVVRSPDTAKNELECMRDMQAFAARFTAADRGHYPKIMCLREKPEDDQ